MAKTKVKSKSNAGKTPAAFGNPKPGTTPKIKTGVKKMTDATMGLSGLGAGKTKAPAPAKTKASAKAKSSSKSAAKAR